MPKVISDFSTVEDLCWGLTFFGTGGGGRIEAGVDMLAPLIASGRNITLVSPQELPSHTLTCWAIIVGGKDPDEPPAADELKQFGLLKEEYPTIIPRLAEAVRELSAYTGLEIGALVSMELSSAATGATIGTAMELGIAVLDCDYVGRAIPELILNKLELLGKSPTPVVMLDRWGNKTIIKAAVGAAMVDRIGRMVSRAAYGRGIATVGHLLPISEARTGFVQGSLLRAIEAGAALRRGAAFTDGRSRLQPLIEATGGFVLAEGEVVAVDWRNTEPYTFRELAYHIEGTGRWAGHQYEIWVKNEHHVVWRDGQPVATSPDIVAILDPATNRPLTTLGDVKPGQSVSVFAMKALDPAWQTPSGGALLGPRHFGFDFDPVELKP